MKFFLAAFCMLMAVLCFHVHAQSDSQKRATTAGKNVFIVDTAFYIPQLKRYRRIWIYLPDGYHNSRKKYPVLYLQDGQNVFDAATSYSGEWGVDEALDTLGEQMAAAIVVAVDNGGDKRFNEYAPFDFTYASKQFSGEGSQYADFLVHTLQPYINKKYRTKRCRKHQWIAGSSMGALISFYTLLKYPKKFGGAGVFSPSFWLAPEMESLVQEKNKKVKAAIYFYAGLMEGNDMVTDMLAVFRLMNRNAKAEMTSVIRASGKHNEASWRQEFPLFYKWMVDKKN